MLGSPSHAVLERMVHFLAHRGPDGFGTHVDEDCGLGQTRLAIVDLDGGKQPLYGERNAVLVSNGEIYNHLNIHLMYPQRTRTSRSDSEAILTLHDAHCSDLSLVPSRKRAEAHLEWVKKLDGMYAFALWSPVDRELILARDPMGIKPLVRTLAPSGRLLVSSEAKALRADSSHVPEIDEVAMAMRIAYEYPVDETTLLKGVTQVRPGSVEVWKIDGKGHPCLVSVATRSTWAPSTTDVHWDDSSSFQLLSSLRKSVDDRRMADVPFGVVLSGGLDSSLIADLATELSLEESMDPPVAWTVAESEDNPDWLAADDVASILEMTHHSRVIEMSDLETAIPAMVWHGEDLDTSVAFFHPLFSLASSGRKVGLCGQGSDELHAGYPRHRDLSRHQALVASRLASMSNLPINPESGTLAPVPAGLGKPWRDENLNPMSDFSDLESALSFEVSRGQLSNFQLRLVDRHSMAHGLEVRVPFLGRDHLEKARTIPPHMRHPGASEKIALRLAASHSRLPRSIIRRPKLPAGTATTPTILQEVYSSSRQIIDSVLVRHSKMASALRSQPDVALGLALFEILHIGPDVVDLAEQDIWSLFDDWSD